MFVEYALEFRVAKCRDVVENSVKSLGNMFFKF
jgi:hypothetical protein